MTQLYNCSKCGTPRTPAELEVVQIFGATAVVCLDGCENEKGESK